MTTHKIEVIGSGCKKCKALFELTKEVVKELNVHDDVEYSTDVTKIVAMGVMSSPVLAVNGKSILAGLLPDKERLKEILSDSLSDKKRDGEQESRSTGCSCGGKC